jgi:hypothetical protein
MLLGIDPFDLAAHACRIKKFRVAPEAKFTAPVYREFLQDIRMVESRPMAVLTLNDLVRRCHVLGILIMAIRTIFFPLVLELEIFPFHLITFAVVAVHESPVVSFKVWRDEEMPYDHESGKQHEHSDKRPPHMIVHAISLTE